MISEKKERLSLPFSCKQQKTQLHRDTKTRKRQKRRQKKKEVTRKKGRKEESKKPTAPKGLPGRSPTPVLSGPCTAWLPSSNGIGYFRCSMAVGDRRLPTPSSSSHCYCAGSWNVPLSHNPRPRCALLAVFFYFLFGAQFILTRKEAPICVQTRKDKANQTTRDQKEHLISFFVCVCVGTCVSLCRSVALAVALYSALGWVQPAKGKTEPSGFKETSKRNRKK